MTEKVLYSISILCCDKLFKKKHRKDTSLNNSIRMHKLKSTPFASKVNQIRDLLKIDKAKSVRHKKILIFYLIR